MWHAAQRGFWPMGARHRGGILRGEYTALVKQDGDWWIGWIEEVPGVNCQERSRDELLESLRETLKEAVEFNRQDALREAGSGYHEVAIAIRNGATCSRI
jgi:predicted RNase H-like HicB family nuclease